MATNSTKSDSGGIYGQTYDVTIDGYAYTLKTLDHALPTSGMEIKTAVGLYRGGGDVVDRETLSAEIDAISGTPAPSQLVVFAQAFHGFTSKYWKVHSMSIKSGNESGRTYSVECKQSIASS